MATNFEFYKDDLSNVLAQREGRCIVMEVEDIMKRGFHRFCKGSDCGECWRELFKYLAEGHIEPPKLTKRERAFCEAVQTGWISGISNRAVFSPKKPVICENETGNYLLFGNNNDSFIIPCNLFEWVKHHEFLSIEDLLKLDVMEVQHETD